MVRATTITQIGDPVLRRPTQSVRRVDGKVRRTLRRLADTMCQAKGVGLAGPQIGVSQRLCVVDAGDELLSLVNPEIVDHEGAAGDYEGCLSVPGWVGYVTRATRVTVLARDEEGRTRRIEAEGLLARALQHEVEHLDGVLFCDRSAELRRVPDAEETRAESERQRLHNRRRLRVVFMGTPDFAVPSLQRLLDAGYHVAGVVTQPDRPRGRGRQVLPPPVKRTALAAGIPVLQPENMRDGQFLERLFGLHPDVICVAAYGRILPPSVLDLPRLGCINVHASLLPRYRGAAPIHRAIMRGETVTGVSIMFMDRGMDTGDLFVQEPLSVFPDDTTGAVHDRLAVVGGALLVSSLDLMAADVRHKRPQDDSRAAAAPPLQSREEVVGWDRQAEDVANQFRGLNPWPGARSTLHGETIKIWFGRVIVPLQAQCEGSGSDTPLLGGRAPAEALPVPDTWAGAAPGEIVDVGETSLVVACGRGYVALKEVQPAGKRRMDVAAFLRGRTVAPGDRFGR